MTSPPAVRLPKLAPTPIKLYDPSGDTTAVAGVIRDDPIPQGDRSPRPGGLSLALSSRTMAMRPPPPTEAPVSPAVRDMADKVRALVARGDVSPTSAIDIIRAATKVGASWDAVEDVVTELAKGADGIAGTADDLIPPSTMSLLRTLLRSGVVTDLVVWVRGLAGRGGGSPGSRWKCWQA